MPDGFRAEAPIRGELLSHDRLLDRMRELAREHLQARVGVTERPLLRRLNENARLLEQAYAGISAAARRQEPIPPAAEWLLDNFHLVEEQLADIRRHLPRGYYRKLPKLPEGALAGYPRVYAFALELISHTDGTLDEQTISACVQAYQEVAPLSIGELWAVAIMLRMGLVENLRRLAAPLEAGRRDRARADSRADLLISAATEGAAAVAIAVSELARESENLSGAYLVRLLQRLRGRGPELAPALDWVDRFLEERGLPPAEELTRTENQRQAADQVSLANTITSFRALSTLDWEGFFERCSVVEAELRQDPAGIYPLCDFATRDACRHAVEELARRTRRDEVEVAREARHLAEEEQRNRDDGAVEGGGQAIRDPYREHRTAHLGYYLIGKGRRKLERRVGYRAPLEEAARRAARSHPTLTYLGAIAALTAFLVAVAAAYAARHAPAPWVVAAAAMLALLPATDLAVSLVNRVLTGWLPPSVLPKLDFADGIPEQFRTLVVIPTLLTSTDQVDELLERVEVHYLANQDQHLQFALLTDYPDADAEERPGDAALLHHAIAGVLSLNERYEGAGSYTRFYLFHRARRWNPAQGVWMGWERKRGKLVELNRLLRGDEETSYTIKIGDRTALGNVRYILSLDSDTQLPTDSARRMVGTLAHPLNRPVFDERTRRVVDGYALLQPRVSISLTSVRTPFTRLFSGRVGMDPYTHAVSDVYQDLFGAGIYVGKGLYDLDAFEYVLEGRVPENALLSHDLFEGSYARCALATDIELFDDYPGRYNTYAARDHRWIRGDWQLLPWLAPRVPRADGGWEANPLPWVARWQILDNMRRSLTAPALIAFLTAGWCALPGAPAAWTGMALVVFLFPLYSHLATAFPVDPRNVPVVLHTRSVLEDAWHNLRQAGLTLAFLAHRAHYSVDAVTRTLWRLLVTRRNLLEWTAAAVAERRLGNDLHSYWVRMGPSAAMGALLLPAVALSRPAAIPVALPFLAAWLLAPVIAFRVSTVPGPREEPLTAAQRARLRLLARRTWRFFEEFVTAETHWLPPDNVQEDRPEPIAHRTSPTNIGLLLLSTLSARDLGYLGLQETADRLERTLWNVATLERHAGHLYNWYETRGATPIPPYYISTVDSGNLAGHLLTLKQGCLELCNAEVRGRQVIAGLGDVVALLQEALGSAGAALREPLEVVRTLLSEPAPSTALEWHVFFEVGAPRLEALCAEAEELCSARGEDGVPSSAGASGLREVAYWCERLRHAVEELRRDLEALLPWAPLLCRQPPPFGDGEPLVRPGKGLDPNRPHVFRSLVGSDGECPRGLVALVDEMGRVLAEVDRLENELEGERWLDDATLREAREWLAAVRASFDRCRKERVALRQRFADLAHLADRLAGGMEFGFLYDSRRDLFSVGYDVAGGRLDQYHYDLLASECRLASFLAVARREAPRKHWFRMGRQLTGSGTDRALVSWSGTMFEYLMPLLVMRAYPGTLLAETLPAVIRIQQRYARRRGVPWGISESAYAARDPGLSYQYRAFGVPGLGLKPDLYEDLVISPYSTILALPLAPQDAVANLAALEREGLACPYGYYEAVDYTSSRLPRGARCEVVRSVMAHHQGMSLVSLANYLLGSRMQDRFHADPLVKSVELLLQERNPREAPLAHPRTQQVQAAQLVEREPATEAGRHYYTPHTGTPRVQLLSNGRYSVMATVAGGGYSRWNELAVTRWREDPVRDHWGTFCYLREVDSGTVWSAAYQPVCGSSAEYEAYFSSDKVEYQRRVRGLVSHMEICVSAEDDVEIRRLSLTNTSEHDRVIEVTSYAEIVLAPPEADRAHPAFSNLFVETELVPAVNALLASRRPRTAGARRPWAFHVLAHEGVPADIWSATEHETDRLRFLGRGRTPAEPAALDRLRLDGATGPVLDPIFSLRQRVRLAPRATVRLAFATGVAATREGALELAERYHDLRAAMRAFDVAWTHAQVELRHLGLSGADAQLFQRLASRLLYLDSYVRSSVEVLARNTQGQSGLWPYGISGDLPIALVQVDAFEHLPLVRQLLLAHEYLGLKGLKFDLVILNCHPPSYLQVFEEALQAAARTEGAPLDQPGGVFIRRAELIPEAGRNLLFTVARAVFSGDRGSLADQLDWRPERREPLLEFAPTRAPHPGRPLPAGRPTLAFDNGLGGFTAEGTEYVVTLGEGEQTPAPWVNVVAGRRCGFVVSEVGSGFTWVDNSRENRLSPWSNDPVSDPPGEVLYLRHEETGRFWSPTPQPIRERNPYLVRHGAGYTVFEHESHGVRQEVTLLAAVEAPVKLIRLRLENRAERVQALSATYYVEWVLGSAREHSHAHITTQRDAETGALLARNPYSPEYANRVAFLGTGGGPESGAGWTCSRAEFLGRNGSPAAPRALRRAELGRAAGADLDPCAALQQRLELAPGECRELYFALGQGEDAAEARALARSYSGAAAWEAEWEAVRALWEEVLNAVQVHTPDPALDLLLNRWLPYQVLACRVWGRSAFYQSGGAYGFRDQLQDVMALIAGGSRTGVAEARAHLIRAAARQFLEGDVQHWWHPPSGRGVRTRFSDDLLWLPYVASYYVQATGDAEVLDERAPFLHGRPLAAGEDEYYDLPSETEETATLYEHCMRALRRGMTVGPHGLPLMGTGDWNDGMNLVGREGRGESVWVAWFLIDTLRRFAPLCAARGEGEVAKELLAAAERYRAAVEQHGWDGAWYRRAYFDDGTPLGSAANTECRIDSIAQSWAVISGAGSVERARQAMHAVEEHLVREKDGLILLFTPPFDTGTLEPGYIKGYVPGVRENGGQYTHAALWVVMATALLGEGDRAHALFSLLNPIRHGESGTRIATYRVEPYVVAADVYGAPPHTGRGGWTWYTGSASWMYRIGLENLLGFRRGGDHFTLEPAIPAKWEGFQMAVRHGTASYGIEVRRALAHEQPGEFTLDGQPLTGGRVPLEDDGRQHQVLLLLPPG